MNTQGSIALVTGASSGIGKATAERLATAGYNVYGTSRRGASTSQQSYRMLPLDVTSNESVEAAVNEIIQLEGRIDLLVNNAGFGVASAGAEESSIEQARSIFETNFFGIVRMTHAVVPYMRKQGVVASSTSAPCWVFCHDAKVPAWSGATTNSPSGEKNRLTSVLARLQSMRTSARTKS
jgi:NAD(P)-dependent dehydrogenase (short-subunit alcohol dehydrogenase family)